MRNKRFEANYSLQDIEAWIGCSQKHGEKIWTRSGLYNSLCEVFARRSKNKTDHEQIEYLFDEGTVYLWKVIERVKYSNQNYSQFFKDTDHFYRYFLKSMNGLFLNKKNNHNTFEDHSEEKKNHNPQEGYFEDEWLVLYQANIIEERSCKIIQAFDKWFEGTRVGSQLKDHCKTIMNVTHDYKYTVIYGFLQSGENSDFFLKKFREINPGINNNTYKSNNRRIREHWRRFLNTAQGRELYAEFRHGV